MWFYCTTYIRDVVTEGIPALSKVHSDTLASMLVRCPNDSRQQPHCNCLQSVLTVCMVTGVKFTKKTPVIPRDTCEISDL